MSGGHGIDLAALCPALNRLFVVEVKGTLGTRWPRLSSAELDQLTAPWLDKPDQPGMAELSVEAPYVDVMVLLIQFPSRA